MVRVLKLSRIFISYKFLKLAKKNMEKRKISFITYANVDIDEYKKKDLQIRYQKASLFFYSKGPLAKTQ
jgi:hypothetical protein